MNKINMEDYGLNERFVNESRMHENLTVGRIASQDKGLYRVITEKGEKKAQISGKFRHNAFSISDYPAVGDFVMLDEIDDGNSIIHHVLTRKSSFTRKAAGTSCDSQVVAANIDLVFICMSLNNDFNLRRLERYIGVAWDGGATPVVVLTKSDLCDNLGDILPQLETVALGVDIIVTSSMTEDGLAAVRACIKNGMTVAFIGSSGVGKSTLVNKLAGENLFATQGIRGDDKGRHTTTKRELIALKSGGAVIDTPGMRELGIESTDLSKTFSDIDELSTGCRFNDCTHTKEPGCAVKEAIKNGTLSESRLLNYFKLKKEANYEGLTSKQIEEKKVKEMFKDFGGIKNAKKYIKNKKK
ncbi:MULTISPECIES: ribosome small subunit-dependent GTPase A [unclassified Sedimentibacter]|uniref:ribosome small subunit-dependent GTPase A n=1 Tax=unclassified Sedimentibacter TaxID=2649220 RepID=UPI0027E1B7DF|nr:ribosome small subunit-dependent GTPase A [Sedimentibacter sp. MB35-C1]WMJ78842.1 ribosome small subunit-dependent GTPase A [Sedimentibacter sp. MB35-C1]